MMAEHSLIEWTDSTWPIVQGCDPVSPGCENCYAIKVVHRLAWSRNPKVSAPIKGCVESHKGKLRFTGKVALREDRLTWPLKWKQPRKIFVPSHGDIFHKDVPDEFLDRIFAVMALSPQHTFQVLTKRAERMREYITSRTTRGMLDERIVDAGSAILRERRETDIRHISWNYPSWPLPKVWLGVSAERQQEADERIPLLLQTPAAVRFVSAEPLLGPIRLGQACHVPDPSLTDRTIDWVIAGGESGSAARPAHPDWFRLLRNQCRSANVPFFLKQRGEWTWIDTADYDSDRIPDIPTDWRDRPERYCCMRIDGKLVSGLGGGSEEFLIKVGKKTAGRLLDGVEHNEFPNIQSQSAPALQAFHQPRTGSAPT